MSQKALGMRKPGTEVYDPANDRRLSVAERLREFAVLVKRIAREVGELPEETHELLRHAAYDREHEVHAVAEDLESFALELGGPLPPDVRHTRSGLGRAFNRRYFPKGDATRKNARRALRWLR